MRISTCCATYRAARRTANGENRRTCSGIPFRHPVSHLPTVVIALALLATGCIGTDYIDDGVAAEVRIASLPDTVAFGDTIDLQATYFNNVGRETPAAVRWASANPDVFRITERGEGIAVSTGETTLSAEVDDDGATIRAEAPIIVGEQTIVHVRERRGTIRTTSSYELAGSFVIREDGLDLIVDIAEDYRASTALPGLFFYLTNNPSTTEGAEEVARVEVFRGAHSYRVRNMQLTDFSHVLYFCKPFNVKVGDGRIEAN